MRKIILASTLCLLSLVGCSLIRELSGKAETALAPQAEVVVPSALLEGDAARFQDSLKPRLNWLASHAPKAWAPSFIAFQNNPDSTRPIGLLVGTTDRERKNAHRKSPEDLAREEARHILKIRPWKQQAIESKLPFPLSVRIIYRSRDFIASSSRFTEDTITVHYADSSATWKGAALEL